LAGVLTYGNAAKLYCLREIERLVDAKARATILDLGCGDARNFEALLRSRPGLRYIGVDTSTEVCAAARQRLDGLEVEIHCSSAYDVDLGPADIVASFSVLEHVYRRDRYMAGIKRNLAPDGVALINYDAGHFVPQGTLRQQRIERWKGRIGRAAARLGQERYYQAFVYEAEFRALVQRAGLQITDAKALNTDVKAAYRSVPEARRDEFMERWLAFELQLNELGIEYRDELATVFRTRSFALTHDPAHGA
jgi:SAM-dependent methyltransferase